MQNTDGNSGNGIRYVMLTGNGKFNSAYLLALMSNLKCIVSVFIFFYIISVEIQGIIINTISYKSALIAFKGVHKIRIVTASNNCMRLIGIGCKRLFNLVKRMEIIYVVHFKIKQNGCIGVE